MYPIFDLHCDLLSFLSRHPHEGPKSTLIPCGVPFLQAGNVKLQVMAVYTDGKPGSTRQADAQIEEYRKLHQPPDASFELVNEEAILNKISQSDKIGTCLAIENAAGICDQEDALHSIEPRLEAWAQAGFRLAYISLTHHLENRFGGGNYTQIGLKPDGEYLLEALSGRKIPVDFSHTSDALAYGILEYIERKDLQIPLLASHSNFRAVWDHPRNLPDDLAQAVIDRGGLIGMNFLRAYVHDEQPEALWEHIRYGLDFGAGSNLAFGADYFDTRDHPDPSRKPFYFPEHTPASVYPGIVMDLLALGIGDTQLKALCYDNARRFWAQLWG